MTLDHDFSLLDTKPCDATPISPMGVYPIENFFNHEQAPFAVVDLGLTEADRQALDKFHIDRECSLSSGCNTLYMQGSKADYQNSTKLYTAGYGQFIKHETLKSDPELMDHLIDVVARMAKKASLSIPEHGTMTSVLSTHLGGGGGVHWHCDPGTESYVGRFLAALKGSHTLHCLDQTNTCSYSCDDIFSVSFGSGTLHRFDSAMHSAPENNWQRLLFTATIER